MKKIVLGLMMLGFAGFSPLSWADAMKIGVVDLQKIVRSSPQIQSIQTKLEQKFRPRRDALMAN